MLNECAIGDHPLKLFLSDEMIVFSIGLSWPRWTSCVWIKGFGYVELEKSRASSLRETLNPNFVGYFSKSLLSRVDFPTPEGPDSTRGLRNSEVMVVEDIAVRTGSNARGERRCATA